MATRVAVLGYGAIGRSIVETLSEAPPPGVELVAVLMRGHQLAGGQYRLPAGAVAADDPARLMRSQPEIVIEAASHKAVAEYGPTILRAGCELFVLSIGALADDALSRRLVEQALFGGGRIVVPSGALGGFDGLRALREMGLTSVMYRSTKPPDAWKGTPAEQLCNLDRLTRPRAFFTGSAREAALQFPRNANLAVAVALAGIGLDRTGVELVADPDARANAGALFAHAGHTQLELRVSGSSFEFNPKSSQITGWSVIATLANRHSAIRYE